MHVIVKRLTDFSLVAKAARNTVSKPPIDREFSEKFKLGMYLSEHSPIRNLLFEVTMKDIPYYSSVHFSRHKIGVEHYVTTQRTDRTGEDRDGKPQDALVTHMMVINAQALINMSRKRLCRNADAVTREAMKEIVDEINKIEPLLAQCLVVDCVYRGSCFEIRTCEYNQTPHYAGKLQQYRNLLEVVR